MAKTNKITQEDIKELFDKTKRKLLKLGKETGSWIKKSEVEISRISKMGKLELDIVNANMKKGKIYRDIGKRIVEQDLGEKIDDSTIRDMLNEARSIINETKKRHREISKIKRGFLKERRR